MIEELEPTSGFKPLNLADLQLFRYQP